MNKIKSILLALIICLVVPLSPILAVKTYALDATIYTSVLEDLQTDVNFDVEDYPVKESDYSVQVIQIAESSDDELFVYVYQPACLNNIKASSINISTDIENPSFNNYSLLYLNCDGVFFKYLVRDFKIAKTTNRYYNISSIFRYWNKTYDEDIESDTENTIDEVSYAVGKKYEVVTLENGSVNYVCYIEDTIKITDKYIGYLRYDEFTIFDLFCSHYKVDSHFIAFSTDINMDRLLSVELEFITQDYEQIDARDPTYSASEQNHLILNYTDVADSHVFGMLTKKYTWNRIETSSEFLNRKGADYDTIAIDNVKNKEYVLSFYECNYVKETIYLTAGLSGIRVPAIRVSSTKVSDVTLMALTFEKSGEVYTLGVIDNKQTGSEDPVGTAGYWNELKDALESFGKIISLILVIVLIVAFIGPITSLVTFLFKIIKKFLQVIIRVLKLPFKIFKK